MKRRTGLSARICWTCALSSGSAAMSRGYRHAPQRHLLLALPFGNASNLCWNRRLNRERVDRAVVEARPDRGADQTVLVDSAQALELRRGDDRAEVIPA